jgi:putative transposase
MRKSRFTEEQIIKVLKEHAAGMSASDLCRKHGISDATFYKWRSRYGGMEISDARKLKGLAEENRKLKKLLAESMLDVSTLKEMLGKNLTTPPKSVLRSRSALVNSATNCSGRIAPHISVTKTTTTLDMAQERFTRLHESNSVPKAKSKVSENSATPRSTAPGTSFGISFSQFDNIAFASSDKFSSNH